MDLIDVLFYVIMGLMLLGVVIFLIAITCNDLGLKLPKPDKRKKAKWRKRLVQLLMDVTVGVVIAYIVYKLGYNK